MSRLVPVALIALAAVGGCSKSTGGAAGQAGASTGASATPVAAVAGTPCDRKLVTEADVAGLFSEPIASMKPLAGDPQSCTFTTSGFSSATVSLRPGLGKASIDMIKSGKTNQKVTDLAGVGERAVWDPMLKEVDAEKNGALCTADATGPASSGATPEKVGAICNKVLAGA